MFVMEQIRAIGKACKARMMHLTEGEAGAMFLSVMAVFIILAAWAVS